MLNKIKAKLKSHRNAGDRHQGRKATRVQRRIDKRKARRDARQQRIEERTKRKGVKGGFADSLQGIVGMAGSLLGGDKSGLDSAASSSSGVPDSASTTVDGRTQAPDSVGLDENGNPVKKGGNTFLYVVLALVAGVALFGKKLFKSFK